MTPTQLGPLERANLNHWTSIEWSLKGETFGDDALGFASREVC
jgi:hypothetical protein